MLASNATRGSRSSPVERNTPLDVPINQLKVLVNYNINSIPFRCITGTFLGGLIDSWARSQGDNSFSHFVDWDLPIFQFYDLTGKSGIRREHVADFAHRSGDERSLREKAVNNSKRETFRFKTCQHDTSLRSGIKPNRILIKTDNNNTLPLQSVADIVEKITVKEYKHYNTAKSITITSDLSPNKTLADAVKAIESIAAELLNKNNTKLEYLGEIKQMNESSGGIFVTFLFALVFIFLVLSAQFESFADSLLILMAVPFSMTGGVLALLLFNNTINMYSNIGLVTLIGLVTKNAIMLVEFTNQLRHQGMKITEAVVQSAKLRLRPILMTSIATIFGALPLVLANGAGAESRNSIGLVIVGGMLIGTLFTIFVIPVLYQTFKKEKSLVD